MTLICKNLPYDFARTLPFLTCYLQMEIIESTISPLFKLIKIVSIESLKNKHKQIGFRLEQVEFQEIPTVSLDVNSH